jgi:hypothetical protein
MIDKFMNKFINKLMANLPDNMTKRKKPMKIDLILGGGAFNGSYILGALYFIKELEKRKHIVIKKISTCSVSSILALLYLTDNLDKANELYFDLIKDFKNKGNLSKLFDIKDLFNKYITNDDCSKYLNKKLYICYNNINTHRKYVINKYNNADELFNVITKSCFVPFMIDYNPCYKDKYVDGMIPYFFKPSKNNDNYKRIYLDVYTLDKLAYTINVRNEKNNYHRLFEGLLDIHEFFIKQCNTTMCSDLDNWSLYNYILYYVYIIVEKITLYFITFISFIKSSLIESHYDVIKPFIEKVIKFFLTTLCF